MKKNLVTFVLAVLISACGGTENKTALTATPSNITPPNASITPTRAPVPTPVAPTPPPLALAPTIRERFLLDNLPGAGHNPGAMVMLNNKVYVANNTTDNLAVLQNDRVVQYIPTGKNPRALAADPAHNQLYVANSQDKTISLIVNDRVSLTTSIGETPNALVFLDNRLYVGSDSAANILVLDPTTLQTQTRLTIPNAFSIINLVGDAVHHRLYAALYDKTAIIDTTNLKILATHNTQGSYLTLLANPTNDSALTTLYDSNTNTNYLTAFDPVSGTIRGRVPVGSDPKQAILTTDGTRAYVANSFSNTVSVIDARNLTLLATIPVDIYPLALALDENIHRLYVANNTSDNVIAIDTQTNQVVTTISLAIRPTMLITNETTRRIYAANPSTDSVFVIQDARVIQQVSVGRHPFDLARDAKHNRILVADAAANTLAVIDEATLGVTFTQPITRELQTVAVDSAHNRVFANNIILDLDSLAPIGNFSAHGLTLGSIIQPNFIRVNPNTNRIYANGGNGVPGSNGRYVTYTFDGDTLQQRGTLNYAGNTSFFALDPESNRVYLAGSHPLAGTNEFAVFDANDAKLFSMSLPARAAGMVYNPQTHHLFLSLVTSYSREFGPTPSPLDNQILILDTTSFGIVGTLNVNTPGVMARLDNTIYVANREDGSITLIDDASLPPPPAPTPTRTLSPYPTLPPPTRTATPRAATVPALPQCTQPITGLASRRWSADIAARIGCPIEGERKIGLAQQAFEHGTLFWRADTQRIVVLFDDKTWVEFDDTWVAGAPEDSCLNIGVSGNGIKPKRGFGKVWCEQTTVRAKIGAATTNEVGLDGIAQRFERGQMFGGIQGPVFVLTADGKWE